MEIIWILGVLFIFVTLVFVTIALLYPEWVGITGSVAKRIEAEQRGDASTGPNSSESDKKS